MLTKLIYNKTLGRLYQQIYPLEKITLLYGGNGAGKSTILNTLKSICLTGIQKSNCEWKPYYNFEYEYNNPGSIIYYSNSSNNFMLKISRNDDITPFELSNMLDGNSEGQAVYKSAEQFIDYIYNSEDSDKNYIVLMDEIDSGLDPVATINLVESIKKLFIKYPHFQFIISFNNFEMLKLSERMLNVYSGKFESTKDYQNDYNKYIEKLKRDKEEFLKIERICDLEEEDEDNYK